MILITGASSGIGEATARAFAERKHDLYLIARRKERLDGLARELRAAHGVTVRVRELDVRDGRAIREWFESERTELEKVRVLVNNAGLAKGLKPIQEIDPEDWDTMIDTNVKGLLAVTRVLLPAMIRAGDGHIVNLGSTAGHYNYPKGNVYCSTKAAVRAITECMRLDLNGTGVRVTEISPGMVETEFSNVRLNDDAQAKAVYSGMTPLTAKDIAETIVWSVERPKHVNIQEIVIYPTDQASPTVVSRKT